MCTTTPAWLTFVFLIEVGFYHVGQAGLELLTSSDPPASASQSAGITGVNYYAWHFSPVFKITFVYINLDLELHVLFNVYKPLVLLFLWMPELSQIVTVGAPSSYFLDSSDVSPPFLST